MREQVSIIKPKVLFKKVAGLTTNIPFIISLCDHPEFIAGNVNTDFIPTHKEKLFEFATQKSIDHEADCCALATILSHEKSLFNQFTDRKLLNFKPNFIFPYLFR